MKKTTISQADCLIQNDSKKIMSIQIILLLERKHNVLNDE